MKWTRIALKDFRGVDQVDVDLDQTQRAVVVGRNGAGKSTTFVWGPLFALFGIQAVNVARARDVVRRGGTTAEALLEFEARNERWRVTRTYSIRTKSGASSLQLDRLTETGWQPYAAGNVGDVQQAIDHVVGATLDALVCGSILRQGEADRFTSAKPTDRLTILSSLLGARDWMAVRAEARTEQAATRAELAGLQTQANQVDTMTARRESLQEARQRLQEAFDGIDQDEDTDDLRDDLDAIERALADFQTQFEQAKPIQEKRDRLKRDAAELARKVDTKRREFERARAAAEMSERRLCNLPDPTTLDALAEKGLAIRERIDQDDAKRGELAKARSRLRAMEFAADEAHPECVLTTCALRVKSERIRAEVEALQTTVADLAGALLDPDEANKLRAKLDDIRASYKDAKTAQTVAMELDVLSASAAETKGRLAELEEDLQTAEQNHAAAVEELDSHFAEVLEGMKRANEARTATRRKLYETEQRNQKRESDRRRIQGELDTTEAKLAEVDTALGELGAALAERTAALKHRSDVLHAVETFAKAAPHLVVAGKVGTVERATNEVLATTFPGARVSIDNQRMLASGAQRDEVVVSVWKDGVEAPIETFSGGERFRLDLAIRIGIATAAGVQSSTLVVDEGFGTQDDEALADVKRALADLTQRFQRVFVISHRPELGDLFADVIDLNGVKRK